MSVSLTNKISYNKNTSETEINYSQGSRNYLILLSTTDSFLQIKVEKVSSPLNKTFESKFSFEFLQEKYKHFRLLDDITNVKKKLEEILVYSKQCFYLEDKECEKEGILLCFSFNIMGEVYKVELNLEHFNKSPAEAVEELTEKYLELESKLNTAEKTIAEFKENTLILIKNNDNLMRIK